MPVIELELGAVRVSAPAGATVAVAVAADVAVVPALEAGAAATVRAGDSLQQGQVTALALRPPRALATLSQLCRH
jgi:hypothetical protein